MNTTSGSIRIILKESYDFSLAWCTSSTQFQLTHNKTTHKKIWSICLLRLCFNHISILPAYLLCNSVLNSVNKVYITCIYAMVRISYHTVSNKSGKYKIGDCMRLDFHCCACQNLNKNDLQTAILWLNDVNCSEIRARYHPNPTPDRWPLESLPLGSETGIQVSAVVGIGDHLGRQLPVSLLVPVSVASVDTTLLPTKFWRRNGVEPEVGALVSILKFGNPQASVIGIGGRLEGSGSLSPSERWFHYS